MNKIYRFSLLFCLQAVMLLHVTILYAQTEAKFDKHLADSLGADEYGMKMYTLVILKTGPAKIDDKQKVQSLFEGHMANINHLASIGKLIVAGPFKKNEKHYEGIFIFNVKTIGETKSLLATDPAINAKLLDTEIFEWYGSAALPLYLQFHDSVKQKDF